MQIKIDSTEDYKLYLKKHFTEKKMEVPDIVMNELINIFKDGMKFARGNLLIEVKDEA